METSIGLFETEGYVICLCFTDNIVLIYEFFMHMQVLQLQQLNYWTS